MVLVLLSSDSCKNFSCQLHPPRFLISIKESWSWAGVQKIETQRERRPSNTVHPAIGNKLKTMPVIMKGEQQISKSLWLETPDDITTTKTKAINKKQYGSKIRQ